MVTHTACATRKFSVECFASAPHFIIQLGATILPNLKINKYINKCWFGSLPWIKCNNLGNSPLGTLLYGLCTQHRSIRGGRLLIFFLRDIIWSSWHSWGARASKWTFLEMLQIWFAMYGVPVTNSTIGVCWRWPGFEHCRHVMSVRAPS